MRKRIAWRLDVEWGKKHEHINLILFLLLNLKCCDNIKLVGQF